MALFLRDRIKNKVGPEGKKPKNVSQPREYAVEAFHGIDEGTELW
jgi:hypothetical protein